MNKNVKLIISIIVTIIIIAVVAGITYSYWKWSTTSNEKTSISFIVPSASELLSATLDGGNTTTVSRLAPAACTNAIYAMKKTITLTSTNSSSLPATVYATLTVSNFTAPYASVEHPVSEVISNIKYAITASTSTDCATGVITGGSGSFSTDNGAVFTDLVLATVNAGQTNQENNYILWVWLDENYTHTNYGSVISDPLQSTSFNLTWSGSITNTPTE